MKGIQTFGDRKAKEEKTSLPVGKTARLLAFEPANPNI